MRFSKQTKSLWLMLNLSGKGDFSLILSAKSSRFCETEIRFNSDSVFVVSYATVSVARIAMVFLNHQNTIL
jgi:hypothetical protein